MKFNNEFLSHHGSIGLEYGHLRSKLLEISIVKNTEYDIQLTFSSGLNIKMNHFGKNVYFNCGESCPCMFDIISLKEE